MTLLTHELRASYAFVERNFNLSRRYWPWEIAFLVYSVAGALSISLIGAAAGDDRLLLMLMIGAIFWNYLSVVFSWIAETIAVERWEGTLEYTFMAPVRRWTQLLGSCLYAMVFGLVHTSVILIVMLVFFRQLELSVMNVPTALVFVLLGSFSIVGIGMMAAILPLLYVERGAQMTFVLQSCLLLVSGVYYPVSVLPEWMQVALEALAGHVRPRRRPCRAARRHPGLGAHVRRRAAGHHGHRPHPDRPLGLRASGTVREAHRQAEAGGLNGPADGCSRLPRALRPRLGPGLGHRLPAVRRGGLAAGPGRRRPP